MRFLTLEKLMNLEDGYRKQVVVANKELLLLQEQGRVHLIQASCPHMHWPLSAAIVDDGTILCRKHHMAFRLDNGKAANEQARGCKALAIYQLSYEGSDIGIWINE